MFKCKWNEKNYLQVKYKDVN